MSLILTLTLEHTVTSPAGYTWPACAVAMSPVIHVSTANGPTCHFEELTNSSVVPISKAPLIRVFILICNFYLSSNKKLGEQYK